MMKAGGEWGGGMKDGIITFTRLNMEVSTGTGQNEEEENNNQIKKTKKNKKQPIIQINNLTTPLQNLMV